VNRNHAYPRLVRLKVPTQFRFVIQIVYTVPDAIDPGT
jgi:hypothetical protein